MKNKSPQIINVSCKNNCISCTACVRIAPTVFRLNGETNMAEVISDQFSGLEDKIILAQETCPVCNIVVDVEGEDSTVVFQMASVKAINKLTSDVIELNLALPNFSYLPGQYVTFKMQDQQGDFFRAYSVVDFKNGLLRLCIKLEKNGRASKIFAYCTVGQKFYISDAKGIFVIPEKGTKTSQNFMVATGTGIAPILAMAKSYKGPKTILFGVRSQQDIIYLDELQNIPNAEVKVVLSQPDESWKGLQGRVTDHLESLNLAPESETYICGNETMIQAVSEKLETLGCQPENIFAESYDPAPPSNHKIPLWQVPISKWSRDNK